MNFTAKKGCKMKPVSAHVRLAPKSTLTTNLTEPGLKSGWEMNGDENRHVTILGAMKTSNLIRNDYTKIESTGSFEVNGPGVTNRESSDSHRIGTLQSICEIEWEDIYNHFGSKRVPCQHLEFVLSQIVMRVFQKKHKEN